MNDYRVLHWRARAAYDKSWREAFGWLARKERVPRLSAAIVTVAQACRPGTPLPDTMASAPTAKAAIDGVVDVGVLPDDAGDYLLGVMFTPPAHGERDRFVLIIEEASPRG